MGFWWGISVDLSDLSHKLERMEGKVDSLTEAVARLAVIEERHLALSTTINRHEERLNGHGHRIRGLETAGAGREVKLGYTSHVLWLIITAAGFLLGLFIKMRWGG